MMEVMRANDQLTMERDAGRAFAGWLEAEPSTRPLLRST